MMTLNPVTAQCFRHPLNEHCMERFKDLGMMSLVLVLALLLFVVLIVGALVFALMRDMEAKAVKEFHDDELDRLGTGDGSRCGTDVLHVDDDQNEER